MKVLAPARSPPSSLWLCPRLNSAMACASELTRTGAQPAPIEPGTASTASSLLAHSLATELVAEPSSWLVYANACCISEGCVNGRPLQAEDTFGHVATTALKIGKAKTTQGAIRYDKRIMANEDWDSKAIIAAADAADMAKPEAAVARPPSSLEMPNGVNDKFHAIFTDL